MVTQPSRPTGVSERTIVITGAGGGLGRAIALRLMRDGYRCVLSDMVAERVQETLASAGGLSVRATAVVGDIRSHDDRRALIATAVEQPDSALYGLVNNAGVARVDPLLDEAEADWRDTMATNLEAPFFLSQLAFEHMRIRGRGRVVNIASVYSIMGFDNRAYGSRAPLETPGNRGPARQSAYAASKGGLVQLTRDLAAAVGPWGITVNAVSPGSIPHGQGVGDHEHRGGRDRGVESRPGLGDRLAPDVLEALAAEVPLGRVGTPDEAAGPVSFLLSDDAAYMTGVNLVVDGGWSIW